MHWLLRLALVLTLLPTPCFGAQGPMDKHVELGLSLPRVEGFESVPIQPGERFIELYFPAELERGTQGATRAAAFVVIVPHQPRRAGDPIDGEREPPADS